MSLCDTYIVYNNQYNTPAEALDSQKSFLVSGKEAKTHINSRVTSYH